MANHRYKKASLKIAKRRRARKYLSIFLRTAFLVSIFALGVVLVRADFLQVKNFEVLGAETILAEDLKNIALSWTSGNQFFLIPKSNIILLNKNNLANVLVSKFSKVEKVEVNKQFFSQKIELKVTERKGEFLWCSAQDGCFNMTKDGLVFERTENKNGRIVFGGILDGNPLMKNFASAEEMQNYLNLIKTFKNAGFDVSSINIELADRAVAGLNIGDIIFNPEEKDLISVAENTILLINNIKSKNPSARFQYIDARFGNKIFYKLI